MHRPLTVEDVSDVLDRVESTPRYRALLANAPSLRARLLATGLELVVAFDASRGDIERFFRASLREDAAKEVA